MAWWPLRLYRVAGTSMLPTYRDGDVLVGWRWFTPAAGQVVVARHDQLLVKRISRIDSRGIWLTGDNPEFSTDSRAFGALGREQITARILWRLTRGEPAGR